MDDVELVLRFFAHRQRLSGYGGTLESYLNRYLYYGNNFSTDLLAKLEDLFTRTIKLVYDIFAERAFRLWKLTQQNRNQELDGGSWAYRPYVTVYDPMMYAFSQHIDNAQKILQHRQGFQDGIKKLYAENRGIFGGYATTNRKNIETRNRLFEQMITDVIGTKS